MSRVLIDYSQNHMATTFTLKISCERHLRRVAESVLEEAHQILSKIESSVSEFIPDSDLECLNRFPVGVEYRPHTKALNDLLNLSYRLHEETRGGFDPSFRSADGISLKDRFSFDPVTCVIRKNFEGARIGFGAIGKGYALDEVALLFVREGFENFLLSAGGSSLVVSGTMSQHTPWRLGWSWEKHDGECYGREITPALRLGKFAVGVSGSMEQGEHVSRRTQNRQILSAFISGPSAANADAYSTALFSDGWERASEWFSDLSRGYARAVIESKDRLFFWDHEFQNRFGSLN